MMSAFYAQAAYTALQSHKAYPVTAQVLQDTELFIAIPVQKHNGHEQTTDTESAWSLPP